eukprot:maker-scaffold_4-snap-gene-9.59-mRNA-1 protein AED:0.17 eAED:0.17 QI:0/0/0/0.66/0/0/3/0/645
MGNNPSTDPFYKIDVSGHRAFADYGNETWSGTGFVVDKQQGIIVTNRHVMGEGPVQLTGKFLLHEEVELKPIYTDPEHDFGFLRFNPSQLVNTPLQEIKLNPEGATPGAKVLVIRNNSDEDLTCVETTVSKIDRPAPIDDEKNSFFISSSDTTVGGSSGSPLINVDGEAVGICSAGVTGENISFSFPLYRVQRALELIQQGEVISRGTIQTSFKFSPFPRLICTGSIEKETAKEIRESVPQAFGLLCIEQTLHGGNGKAAGLCHGGVLVRVNDTSVVNFVQLDDYFDANVGEEVKLKLFRDGEEVELNVVVEDFHQLNKKQYVEISNAIIQPIYSRYAYINCVSMNGIFLVKSGLRFRHIPVGSIILSVNGTETNTLENFISVLSSLADGSSVPVKYRPRGYPEKVRIKSFVVNKKSFQFVFGKWDEDLHDWKIEEVKSVPSEEEVTEESEPEEKKTMRQRSFTAEEINFEKDEWGESCIRSLVQISCKAPFSIDGEGIFAERDIYGCIVDASVGLVMVSIDDIPHSLVDVWIFFERVTRIKARVVFIDPVNSLTFLKYDPDELTKTSKPEDGSTCEPLSFNFRKTEVTSSTDLYHVRWDSNGEVQTSQPYSYGTVDKLPWKGKFWGHVKNPFPIEIVSMSKSSR